MKLINKVNDGNVYQVNDSTLVKIGKDVEIRQDTWDGKEGETVTFTKEEIKEIAKNL